MRIKKTHENAKLPWRAHPTDAGADLFSPEEVTIPAHESRFVDLGIQMELPKGTTGLIFARSGLGGKGIRPRNCAGVVDEKYRGNVGIMMENHSDKEYTINVYDRIAQLVIVPVLTVYFDWAEELDMEGDRQGGFGSTEEEEEYE